LKIRPREKVAIVGLSGAGKSTVISLLMRAYRPDSGKIFLDGIDYEKIDPDQFRSQVGIVEQNIQLMDDTLRANLLIGLSSGTKVLSDKKLWEVMALANVTKFKDRLTKGLDTLIGEGGVKLSGGEKQRVAIARALLKNPSIIIFDEATSNLDGITEMELREAIENANRNRTSISIAHRLATVINSDRIIVVDGGRVVAEGEHTELKEKCEIYRQLIKTQTAVF
jgi:ABC-type multidrug transport system fused ATPase/permease subunit